MQEEFFLKSMEADPRLTGEHGAEVRLAQAKKAQDILKRDLDEIVIDDKIMYQALLELVPLEDPKHNPMQNALRKYYFYINGKEFPRLKQFHG